MVEDTKREAVFFLANKTKLEHITFIKKKGFPRIKIENEENFSIRGCKDVNEPNELFRESSF